jgi:excisionase family DNA binding protein
MKPNEIILNTTQNVERRWFDLPHAADYMCVNVRTIRELIWCGALKYSRIGKRFIIDRADLDALAERRKHSEPMKDRAKTD